MDLGQILSHLGVLLAGIDEDVLLRPQPAGGVQEAGVGEQLVAPGGADEQHPGGLVALGVVQFKAAQVVAVGRMGDQKGGASCLAQTRAQLFAPLGVHVGGEGCVGHVNP